MKLRVETKNFENIISIVPLSPSELSLILTSLTFPLPVESKNLLIKNLQQFSKDFSKILDKINEKLILSNKKELNISKFQKLLLQKNEKVIEKTKPLVEENIKTIPNSILKKVKKRYGNNYLKPLTEDYLGFLAHLKNGTRINEIIFNLANFPSPYAFVKVSFIFSTSNLANILKRNYNVNLKKLKKEMVFSPIDFKERVRHLIKTKGIMFWPLRVQGESELQIKKGTPIYIYKVPEFLRNYPELAIHFYFLNSLPSNISGSILSNFNLIKALNEAKAILYLKEVEGINLQTFNYENLFNLQELRKELKESFRSIEIKRLETNDVIFKEYFDLNWYNKLKSKWLTPKEKKKEKGILTKYQKIQKEIQVENKKLHKESVHFTNQGDEENG